MNSWNLPPDRILWVFLLALGGCMGALELAPDDSDGVLNRHLLDAPSPLETGPHPVGTLYYGSGTDKNRLEYRDSVAFTTPGVDASRLVSLGDGARSRNRYWGFSPDAFPLNGRVWYPEGSGPFPLVLVAHGNHDMKDFSDPGYEYLGRHLASRGFVMASLDMNFLNGNIRAENDARGWMFLKHLEAWRAFNEDPENPFYGKVDLERVGLVGHSRGGEAVGHAAAFNRLSHYPDDATIRWEFGFGIQALVAIAPVDGQYRPASRLVPLENVNYLVFHGTHDGDVTSFAGLRAWSRLRFTDGVPRFKSSVYVHRANHGQWNTVWGPHDRGPRSGRSLDLRGLLDGEEQRRLALVYVTAFLEASLLGGDHYLPLFRDHRVVGGWLPRTMYITQFQESTFKPVATFQEDIDVTTGTLDGVRIRGDSLASWREDVLPFRYLREPSTTNTQENHAVWLGWNNRIAGPDTTRLGPPAAYTLLLPDTLASAWAFGPGTTLDFMLSVLDQTPRPRREPSGQEGREGEGQGETARKPIEPAGSPGRLRRLALRVLPGWHGSSEEGEMAPVNLSLLVTDTQGNTGRVLLDRYGPVRRPIPIRIHRRGDQRFRGDTELVLQSYSIPLEDFLAASNGSLELETLREITFLFDVTEAGTVVLDDVGFSRMDPAFLRASASR